MERNGPLASTALFKPVLMQISDLVPPCKFTNLLQEHPVLISWRSLHGSICDQRWYISQWWQIATSQHPSLQEPFEQNVPWNGPKNTALFNANKYLPHCHHCILSVSAYTLPPLCEAEHCWQGGMAGFRGILTMSNFYCIKLHQSTECSHQSQWELLHKVQGFAEGRTVNLWPSRESSVSPHSGDLMRGLASAWSV